MQAIVVTPLNKLPISECLNVSLRSGMFARFFLQILYLLNKNMIYGMSLKCPFLAGAERGWREGVGDKQPPKTAPQKTLLPRGHRKEGTEKEESISGIGRISSLTANPFSKLLRTTRNHFQGMIFINLPLTVGFFFGFVTGNGTPNPGIFWKTLSMKRNKTQHLVSSVHPHGIRIKRKERKKEKQA